VQSIGNVTTTLTKGDLTQWIEIPVEGAVNSMVDQLNAFATEVTRVALDVGTEETLDISKT
jgi:osomolarity two-component system, sensor histidine kinase NIK1